MPRYGRAARMAPIMPSSRAMLRESAGPEDGEGTRVEPGDAIGERNDLLLLQQAAALAIEAHFLGALDDAAIVLLQRVLQLARLLEPDDPDAHGHVIEPGPRTTSAKAKPNTAAKAA